MARQLPMLDLPTADGGRVDWHAWWQHRNLLLVFLHPDEPRDGACHAAVAALRSDDSLTGDEVVPVFVWPQKPPSGQAGHHVIDEEGRLARAVGAGLGSVVAVDRFFEVLGIGPLHDDPETALRRMRGLVQLAEIACPECGVSTWD